MPSALRIACKHGVVMTSKRVQVPTTLPYLAAIPLIVLGFLSMLATSGDSTAAVGDPIPDIKANDSDGPVSISSGANLSISVTLDAGGNTAQADWWAVAETPFGLFYFDPTAGRWKPGLAVSHQGPLFDLAPFTVLSISSLPPGAYIFHFGVDLTMNGSLDQPLFVDNVAVNISQFGVWDSSTWDNATWGP